MASRGGIAVPVVAECGSCEVFHNLDGFRSLPPPPGALVVRYRDGESPAAIERRECQCGDMVTAQLDSSGAIIPLTTTAILRGLTGGVADVPPPVRSAGLRSTVGTAERWMRITKRYLVSVLRCNDNPTAARIAIRNGWERANDEAKQ